MEQTTAPTVKVIRKSISINAPRERVWRMITEPEFAKKWYEVFCDGGVNTDLELKQGGKAVFTDNSGNGMIGKVATYNHPETLVFEFDGQIVNGKEDYDSEQAKAIKGSQERYYLKNQNGATLLEIEADMHPDYFDMMSEAWDKGLQKVKEMAEEK